MTQKSQKNNLTRLNHCRIVLIQTSHPGNIGAAARAMKTMGLSDLCLVNPKSYPHPKATEMASGATDVLNAAKCCNTLDEAISDCHFIVGTSARDRAIPWPLIDPKVLATKAMAESEHAKVAILFGREQTGLTNEELQRCHYHVQIPANPEYSSLNISAALQVIAYELRMAALAAPISEKKDRRDATALEMEYFFKHLEDVLQEYEFLKINAPRQLMPRLRRLFLKVRPDVIELNILRGMLTAVQKKKDRE